MWVQTYSGQAFDLKSLDPTKISIEDIGHSLSMQCRYNGHTRRFYSVAEHSVRVSYIAEKRFGDRKFAIGGLLHDAAEAYIGDMVTPIKKELPGMEEFVLLENEIQAAIESVFFLPCRLLSCVEISLVDKIMGATEKRDLMYPCKRDWGPLPEPDIRVICPWEPQIAKLNFLNRAYDLGIVSR